MYSNVLFLAFATLAVARTDLSGCVSSETVAYGGASLLWYVPGTGEICAFLDCGGGAGAPVTTVPGCADYSGTATYSPSYLANYNAGSASSTSYVPATTSTYSSSMITGSQTSQPTTGITSSSSDASASDVSTSSTSTASGITTTVKSSSSSTGTKSASSGSSSSSSAPAASATGNAGASTSVNVMSNVFGALLAGIAFLL